MKASIRIFFQQIKQFLKNEIWQKSKKHTVAQSWASSTERNKSSVWSVASSGVSLCNNRCSRHSRAWLSISWIRTLMTGACISTLGACWKLSRRNRKTPADDRKSVADASRPETVRRFYNTTLNQTFCFCHCLYLLHSEFEGTAVSK